MTRASRSIVLRGLATIVRGLSRRYLLTLLTDIALTLDSWGPPGNPYEGGPGEGQYGSGSGSGSSSNNNLVFQSSANCFEQISLSMIAGICFLAIALFL